MTHTVPMPECAAFLVLISTNPGRANAPPRPYVHTDASEGGTNRGTVRTQAAGDGDRRGGAARPRARARGGDRAPLSQLQRGGGRLRLAARGDRPGAPVRARAHARALQPGGGAPRIAFRPWRSPSACSRC